MSGFTDSTHFKVLEKYIPYLSHSVFEEALNHKIQNTRQAKDKARLEEKRVIVENHLQQFFGCQKKDEEIPTGIVPSVHFAGALCEWLLTKDQELAKRISNGQAFGNLTAMQGDKSIVWDEFEQDKMKRTSFRGYLYPKRKPTKRPLVRR